MLRLVSVVKRDLLPDNRHWPEPSSSVHTYEASCAFSACCFACAPQVISDDNDVEVQADGLNRLLKAIDDPEARVQRKGLQVLPVIALRTLCPECTCYCRHSDTSQ